MVITQHDVLFSVLLLQALCGSVAKPSYADNIPNGRSVYRNRQLWEGVGHEAKGGSGPLNPFGSAFSANKLEWTLALCQADSDNDGETNGVELGDPDCQWSKGQTPSRVTDISHPGFSDATTSTEAGLPVVNTDPPTSPPGSSNSQGCFLGASVLMASGSTPYACFVNIGGGIEMHWTPDTSAGRIDFTLRRRMTDGFMALAVTADLGVTEMSGGEALIITPSDWDRYTLGSSSVNKQSKTAAIPFTFTGSSLQQENGWVEFRVTGADLASMTKYSNVPQNLDALVPLIWSKRDSGGIGYHGDSEGSRNGRSINFATGASEAVGAGSGVKDDVELHGILEITAWTFLAPLGILVKRLGAQVHAFQKVQVPYLKLPVPYVIHVLLMILAVALSFWGQRIAASKFDHSSDNVIEYGHGATAMITIILALSQPLPAIAWQLCKPRPDSPRFKTAKLIFSIYHPSVGTAALILGIITVFTGIANYDEKYQDDDKVSSFKGAALAGTIVLNGALIALVVLLLACPNWFTQPEDKDKVAPSGNDSAGEGSKTTFGKAS